MNTKLLTSGVATEIAAMPAAASHRLRRAQATARRCSSPSVFMSSQHAAEQRVPGGPLQGSTPNRTRRMPMPGPGLKPGDVAAETSRLARAPRSSEPAMKAPSTSFPNCALHAEVEGDASQDDPSSMIATGR